MPNSQLTALSISNHTYTHVTSSANQGCTNPGRQAFWASKFCMVAPNICWSSVWSSLHTTLPAPRIFKWLLDTWKVCAPLRMSYKNRMWFWGEQIQPRHMAQKYDPLSGSTNPPVQQMTFTVMFNH